MTEPIWWQKPCSGPYEDTCLDRWDEDIAGGNLRLFQWCSRCLFELSVRHGYRFDGAEPERPALVKGRRS